MKNTKLQKLFDYQIFSGNREIEKMYREAENRNAEALSLDDLAFVAGGVRSDEAKDEKQN